MKTEKLDVNFTTRVLLALVTDVAAAWENLEALKVKIEALAKEHGIEPVSP